MGTSQNQFTHLVLTLGFAVAVVCAACSDKALPAGGSGGRSGGGGTGGSSGIVDSAVGGSGGFIGGGGGITGGSGGIIGGGGGITGSGGGITGGGGWITGDGIWITGGGGGMNLGGAGGPGTLPPIGGGGVGGEFINCNMRCPTGGAGGTAGSGGTGGKAGAGGSGGTGGSTINCALVGCAMPPMCATGCTETCGCCPCAEGTWQSNLVCRGGCWAVPDAGVDSGSAVGAFESFRLTQSYGPCPSGSDCVGYIDLDKAGQLLRDPVSSLGAPVGSASVTPAELASAIAVFTDPALVKLLDASSPPCVPPTDIFESMKLVAGGVTHDNSTTMCDNAPVKAARDLIYQLGDKYLPPPSR